MRVLIFSHAFAPKIGGVETFAMLLARGLVTGGNRQGGEAVEVTLATPTPQDGFDDSLLPFRVTRQPGLWELITLLRRADIVHLAGPSFLPLFLGLILRKPVVVEQHGYQAVCPNGLLFYRVTETTCPGHFMARRYWKCVECNRGVVGFWKSLWMLALTFPRRWMSRACTLNAPISHHVHKRLELPNSRVIYYGIEDPSDGASSVSGSSQRAPICFAYVGRLVKEKGLPLLLQAAKRLEERGYSFQLKFIGDGPERAHLEAVEQGLRLRQPVHFTGYVRDEALRKALGEVSVVVLPSVWEETAGLAAIEQMMHGRLVIVADVGGLVEVVGEAGLKFPMGDVNGLSACLQRVMDHPELVAELGAAARERAARLFALERMVGDHRSVYEELLPPTERRRASALSSQQ